MNKKYIAFSFMALFVVGLATAGLISYYGSVKQELSIESPIIIGEYEAALIDALSGESRSGDDITINNNADYPVGVNVDNNAPEGITVDYIGTLELTKKDVDFTKDVWIYDIEDAKVQVEYTVVGDSFSAEVTEGSNDEYVLIYYKDNSDRFNDPAEAVLIEGNSFTYLPYHADRNSEEAAEYNYCDTVEYSNCHGAKIWYVPSNAVDAGVIDWTIADEFYFETNLIQYNADGDIIVYDELVITPVYDVNPLFVGEATINTTIMPTA